jgi:hypothetical protein
MLSFPIPQPGIADIRRAFFPILLRHRRCSGRAHREAVDVDPVLCGMESRVDGGELAADAEDCRLADPPTHSVLTRPPSGGGRNQGV